MSVARQAALGRPAGLGGRPETSQLTCPAENLTHRVVCTRDAGHRGRHEYRTAKGELVHQWNQRRRKA